MIIKDTYLNIDLDISLLDNYKAKKDGTTLLTHINKAIQLANQIKNIYDLDINIFISLCKCIIYHDLGKVTEHFQSNIDTTSRLVRHEILSASIKGLLDNERLAIITHHKDLKSLEGYLENVFYESELNQVSEKLGVEVEDIRPFIRKINRTTNELIKDLNNILLKGYLQYCDHLSSAGVQDIEYGFSAIDSYKYSHYNSIQTEILNLKSREDILIIGPTGVGKTAASLFWGDIVQNQNNSRRIYYLLPFIASINALYKDMHERNLSVSMLHNKAEYFLGKIENDKDIKNLYQLFKKSVKQINILTIYQIVKCIFACKRFEMLLAQFKNSIFIVDEIHCFDIEQTALLVTILKFLKDKLNISICIMSASIPSELQMLICSELDIKKVIRASKEDYKVRHRLHRVKKDIFSSLDKIKEDLANNKKVILCVNTVATSQELFKQLEHYNPTLIHGKMNTRDREKAEDKLNNCIFLIGTQAIEVSLNIDYDTMYTEIAPFDSLLQRLGRVNRYGFKGIADIFIYNQSSMKYGKRGCCRNEEDIFVYNQSSNIYKKELIELTDIVIDEIINEHSGIVREEDIQKNLDKVYKNIDFEKYYSESNKVNMLIDFLKVGTYSNTPLDNMISSNTITVLPASLEDEYKELINNKKFLEANSLFVNVRYTKFISKHTRSASYFREKIDNVFITDLIYDERGLIYDERGLVYEIDI